MKPFQSKQNSAVLDVALKDQEILAFTATKCSCIWNYTPHTSLNKSNEHMKFLDFADEV